MRRVAGIDLGEMAVIAEVAVRLGGAGLLRC